MAHTGPGSWYVYMLKCSDGSLYTGITRDLERRVHEHNHTAAGARYTRARRPVSLVFSQQQASRGDAARREAAIKKLPRQAKQALLRANAEQE